MFIITAMVFGFSGVHGEGDAVYGYTQYIEINDFDWVDDNFWLDRW